MASTETPQLTGQPHLQKQDLATLVCDLSIDKKFKRLKSLGFPFHRKLVKLII